MSPHISLNHDLSETINYVIPQFPLYIRRSLLSECRNYGTVSHWHEDIEFIYVFSGEMQYDINGKVVTIREKQGIFVNSRNFHYGFSEKMKECDFLCIIIHPSLFSGNSYLKDHYILPLTECTCLPYLLLREEPWHQKILEDLITLYQLNTDEDSFYPESQIIISKIFCTLYKHTKNIMALEKETTNHTLAPLREMVRFIQAHYQESLTLEDIASVGTMGKTSCTNAFKTYMHTTPIDYLLTYRMAQSMSLLTNTDKSITEIAYEVGFHDSSYYTKFFKKYYGSTPRQMRASQKSRV